MQISPQLLAALRADAAARLDAPEPSLKEQRYVYSFSSTGLGFPGIAGQAFTDGRVIVMRSDQGACVYVSSAREGSASARLAYRIGDTNAAFEADLTGQQLAGAERYAGQYDNESMAAAPEFEVRGSTRGVRRGPHALSRAIDEAYMISRYGLVYGKPRSAEVLVAGTDTVVMRTHPEDGDVRIERLEAIEPFTDAARFPRISA
jgi:hypothetical protein